MKALLTFFLVLTYFCFYGQKYDPISSFDLYYGYRPQFQNFYNQLTTVNDFDFGKPLQMIGIGSSGNYVINMDGNFTGHLIYNQIIPRSIHVQDTLKGKLSGFIFSLAVGSAFTIKSEKFAFYYYVGLNTGRLRMYGNDLIKQKNAFVSPKIGIQPKIRIGKISLSLILDYAYDLSKSDWKKTLFSNGNKVQPASLRQTGFTGQFGIGRILE